MLPERIKNTNLIFKNLIKKCVYSINNKPSLAGSFFIKSTSSSEILTLFNLGMISAKNLGDLF